MHNPCKPVLTVLLVLTVLCPIAVSAAELQDYLRAYRGGNYTCSQNVDFTGTTVERLGAALLLNKWDATAAPTANDDTSAGYAPGSLWVNVTADTAYICVDATAAAASWKQIDSGMLSGYLKADGSIPLTANWDAGSFEIRAQTFESDVATGTAPMTIASETLVTHLNADLLDGESASAFQDASAVLTTYAGINPSANVQSLLGCADYAAMRTALSLVPNTNVQAYDADLADLADQSYSGTWTNLGSVTTIDINGGTIDGASIGASSPSTGVFTTLTGKLGVTAHTGTGAITAAECLGGTVTNTGASGAIVLTLPAAVVGYSVLVYLTAAFDVNIDPNGTDQILGLTNSAGDAISSDATVGSCVTLMCFATGYWSPYGGGVGTWTDVN